MVKNANQELATLTLINTDTTHKKDHTYTHPKQPCQLFIALQLGGALWRQLAKTYTSLGVWRHAYPSPSPRPQAPPTNRERGLVSLAKIPVCAKSACYATHLNNHIPYIIDSLRSPLASALGNVIIGNGMLKRDSSTPNEDCWHSTYGNLCKYTRPHSQFLGRAWGRGYAYPMKALSLWPLQRTCLNHHFIKTSLVVDVSLLPALTSYLF